MADSEEKYWWKKYIVAESNDATQIQYAHQLMAYLDKSETPEENLKLVIANNLLTPKMLSSVLRDKQCPEEFFEKALEGALASKEQFGRHFLHLIAEPKISLPMLKNCFEFSDRLTDDEINRATATLLQRKKIPEAALSTMIKSLIFSDVDRSTAIKSILQNPNIPSQALKLASAFLPLTSDKNNLKDFCLAVIKHQNCNETVAKNLVCLACKQKNDETLLKTDVDLSLLKELINHQPADKGTLYGTINLLSHIDNKQDFMEICHTVLKNKNCTQDVVKSLLHKASYTEHFEDVYQLIENSNLLTKNIKEKIANIRQQYPVRLADQKRQEQFVSYIRAPKSLPRDLTPEDLKDLVDTVSRYPGLELKYEDKVEIYEAILDHPNCKAAHVNKILQNAALEDKVYDKISAGYKEAWLGKKLYSEFKQNRYNISALINEKFDKKQMKEFILAAQNAVQSGDVEAIGQFKEKVFAAGEDAVYKLDHNAVAWFIENGTPENLEALNALRGMYGLKTVIEEFSHADADRTDARRAIFGGELSAVNKYINEETSEINPHYIRKHSDKFLKFQPENYMEEKFKPEDYDLSQNEAWQKMRQEGLRLPLTELAKAMADMHVPPALANEFNATDLIHFFLEYHGADVINGQAYSLQNIDTKMTESVRESYWKKIADNEEIVDFISKDLWRKGVSQDTIEQIWENCRNYGTPCKGADGKSNVFSISLQIHHRQALKDDGKNEDDNFMIVVSTEKGSVSAVEINSHKPLHEYDNPSVALYLNESGTLVKTPSAKRVKVLTFPSVACHKGESVAVYLGPSENSCGIIKADGHLQSAQYTDQLVAKESVRDLTPKPKKSTQNDYN